MVLRENIDFQNLSIDAFKKFKCLCELCDCGCFERNKQVHATDCQRHAIQKSKLTSYSAVAPGKCSLSHYKDTFRFVPEARPATTVRPPNDNYLEEPKGSFDFNTTQKREFKTPEYKPRVQPYKFPDNYEFSSEAVSGLSSYIADFKPTGNLHFPERIKKNPNQVTMSVPQVAFGGISATNDHFQSWEYHQPSKEFCDRPSYAGLSLFPTLERNFETSTKQVHDLKIITKRQPVIESKGTLCLEGKQDFTTSNRVTFVEYPGFETTQPIIPQKGECVLQKSKLATAVTQNSKDFIFHANHRPPKPADCNPYLSKVENDLYPGHSFDHTTTQRTQFPGVDVTTFTRAKSFKAPDKVYEPPTEKVLGETVSMRDFKPIDISRIPILKAIKREGTLKVPAGPMETNTTSSLQFLKYDVKPQVRYGDQHPGEGDYYYPPATKFSGSTTTASTFQGKTAPRRMAFQPESSNIDIKKGSYDFNTVQKLEFKNHGLSMCEAKAYLIAKSLHDKKNNLVTRNRSNSLITLQA